MDAQLILQKLNQPAHPHDASGAPILPGIDGEKLGLTETERLVLSQVIALDGMFSLSNMRGAQELLVKGFESAGAPAYTPDMGDAYMEIERGGILWLKTRGLVEEVPGQTTEDPDEILYRIKVPEADTVVPE